MNQTVVTALVVGATAGWLAGLWMGVKSRNPRRSSDSPPRYDLRRRFNHENINRSITERPQHVRRTVRFDEGRIRRSHAPGAGYQPKPSIDPRG